MPVGFIRWFVLAALWLLVLGCAGDGVDGDETVELVEPVPTEPASASDSAPAASPESASAEPAPTSSEVDVGSGASSPERQTLIGATVLGAYGSAEVFLSPAGPYGYVQPGLDAENDLCLQPLLDAARVCTEVSGPGHQLQPRWDAAGTRMAFASYENPDLMVVDAIAGTVAVTLADEDAEDVMVWRTQSHPGWVGSRLVAHRVDGSLTMVDPFGVSALDPGWLADPAPPPTIRNGPPAVSTGAGSVVVAVSDVELIEVSLTSWRSFPFPDDLERRSSRPGPSALRPPLIPIGTTSAGRLLVADSLPGEARKTGDWAATSGAWLLDLDTGEYSPVFVDGTTQSSAVVSVGITPARDAVVFLWADDAESVNPVMRMSTAPLGEGLIDPREADVLVEAEVGVVLSGSDRFNPLVWTTDGRTAFRVDGDWTHLQLDTGAARPAAPDDPGFDAQLIDFLWDNAASSDVARCMRGRVGDQPSEEPDPSFDEAFAMCEGDSSTRQRLDRLVDEALIPEVRHLATSRAMRECLASRFQTFSAYLWVEAARSCDPRGVRAELSRRFESLDAPQRYNACLTRELYSLDLEEVEQLAGAAPSSDVTAGPPASLHDRCAADLVAPEIPGPLLAEIVEILEGSPLMDEWDSAAPTQRGERFEVVRIDGSDGSWVDLVYEPETTRVVGVELSPAWALDLVIELSPAFGHWPEFLRTYGDALDGLTILSEGTPFVICASTTDPAAGYRILADVYDTCA